MSHPKAKIMITGIPEKEPKIHENGNVDLIFKVEQSTAIPKGLEPLKECLCFVHVAPKTWKKVAEQVQPESKLLVQEKVSPRVNKSGKMFLEIVVMDIGLIESSAGEKAQPKEPQGKMPVIKLGAVKGTEKFVLLSSIHIPEELTPPNSSCVRAAMMSTQARKTFRKPLLLSEQNVLLEGYEWYLAAKELNIENVPIAHPKQKPEPKIAKQLPPQRVRTEDLPVPPMETWKSIPITDIKIPPKFLLTLPNPQNIAEVRDYVQLHGQFDRPVTLDASNKIVNGYKRYVVAVELNMESVSSVYTE